MRSSIIVAVAFAGALLAPSAHALDEAANASTRGPFYVQGDLGSFGFWTELPAVGTLGYWHPDIEFGYHFSGRHDGVVLAIRQGFDVGRDHYAFGQTVLRGGYDLAFPFRNGRFEVTVAPYGILGINYFFEGPQAGVHFGAGLELKLFFFRGVYLMLRPIELAAGQFVIPPGNGFNAKNVYFNFNAGLGAGFAF